MVIGVTSKEFFQDEVFLKSANKMCGGCHNSSTFSDDGLDFFINNFPAPPKTLDWFRNNSLWALGVIESGEMPPPESISHGNAKQNPELILRMISFLSEEP